MKEKLYQSCIELTNGKLSSIMLKSFSKSKVSKYFIRSYTKVYHINVHEISKNIKDYSSLHEFFIRELKSDARPLNEDQKVFVSPVDAKVETFGQINEQEHFVVKGKNYSIHDLLGCEKLAETYKGGQFIVFYLSPADYHRMHSPINARVNQQLVLGKKSYPVNQWGLSFGKKPLSHNYRLVTDLTYNDNKRTAFIKVGAMFVNSIELTNTSDAWVKGQEVGYFTFGSTVVMLFEKDTIEFQEHIARNKAIRVGEAFANML